MHLGLLPTEVRRELDLSQHQPNRLHKDRERAVRPAGRWRKGTRRAECCRHLWAPEDVPEAEGLVCACRHDARPVRGLRHVEYSGRVPIELGHLGQRRVLPQAELVLGVAVAREDLPVVPAPLEGADLGSRVDRVDASASVGVPELQAGRSRL